MGRPPADTEAVTVRIERTVRNALDEWRREQSDLPSGPETIRRLIRLGLNAQEAVKSSLDSRLAGR